MRRILLIVCFSLAVATTVRGAEDDYDVYNTHGQRVGELRSRGSSVHYYETDPRQANPSGFEQLQDFIYKLKQRRQQQILQAQQAQLQQAQQAQLQQAAAKEAMLQIEAAAKKYPDFFDYRQDIAEISRRNPNLSAEECYLIAKSRASHK